MTQGGIVAQAHALIDTPWVHRGRDENGLDCIGLICKSYKGAGWVPNHPEAVESALYAPWPENDGLLETLRGEAIELHPPTVLQLADILVFRLPSADYPWHVSLVSRVGKRDYFIHANALPAVNRVRERVLNSEWRKLLCAVFRLEAFA